jgi:DNA-binding transcriptional LysR family regulator
MELRQLEYFVTVAEEASFTRAASRLFVSQPGVSAQVRRLERELGHELFDRSGRAVRVTDVGEALLPHARAALAAVARIGQVVDDLTGLVRGRVAIGSVTAHNIDLHGMLAGFHIDHPGVEMTLGEGNSDQLVESLQAGRLDVAIISLPGPVPAGLEAHVVVDEPLVAVVSVDHPLAARSSIHLRDLHKRGLISLPRGTGLRASLEQACTRAGFSPQFAFEASDPGAVADLAARGLGVAIVPESVTSSRPHLHVLALSRPRLRGRLAFAWRREAPRSPAARVFIDRVRAGFPDLAGR